MIYINFDINKLIKPTLKNIQILQLLVALVTFDAILWSNKTRNLTPFEIMTTLEGKYVILNFSQFFPILNYT